jgi:hypothetical protein
MGKSCDREALSLFMKFQSPNRVTVMLIEQRMNEDEANEDKAASKDRDVWLKPTVERVAPNGPTKTFPAEPTCHRLSNLRLGSNWWLGTLSGPPAPWLPRRGLGIYRAVQYPSYCPLLEASMDQTAHFRGRRPWPAVSPKNLKPSRLIRSWGS